MKDNNISEWTSKQWYCYLLERKYLRTEAIDIDGSSSWEDAKCQVETTFPHYDWVTTWARARLPGLTNESRTTLWLFFHNLLPSQSRLHRILRAVEDPCCLHCDMGEEDHTWFHTFSSCTHAIHVIDWMTATLNTLAIQRVDKHTALWLQFPPPITETDLLCAVWLVGESLTYVWARRKNREELSLNSLKLILKTKAVHMSKTDKYSNAGRQLIDILSAA